MRWRGRARAPGSAAACIRYSATRSRASSYVGSVPPADTLVHLVGTPKPDPSKVAQFRAVDLASLDAAVAAAHTAGVKHLVYVSVAQPAPVMRAYVEARKAGEAMIRASGLNATILRPWYVLGPGHRWPVMLKPLYKLAAHVPAWREPAQRLGLVDAGADDRCAGARSRTSGRRRARGGGADDPLAGARLTVESIGLYARPACDGPLASIAASATAGSRRRPAGALNSKVLAGSAGLTSILLKRQHRTLAEGVEDLERRQCVAAKADLHALQLAVLALGRGLDPLQAVAARAAASSVKSACSARRSGAAAISAAGVEPSACCCLRCVTWFRSASYSHSVWPSATMVCSNGFL